MPTCNDRVKNQNEADVDCGGGPLSKVCRFICVSTPIRLYDGTVQKSNLSR